MNSSRPNCYNNAFSHIYVERAVMEHPRTRRILGRFPNAAVIEIGHYKDVFCRRRQRVHLQNQVPMLILAAKREHLVYRGAEVCQFFGEPYFYYTSCAMNCMYDCEYCYLKGMYPSGNLVIFVNLEDIFSEVRRLLREHGVYLCISYDTDLIALEDITGFVGEWAQFAAEESGLKLECRTKCARTDLWKKIPRSDNLILAFTISPQRVITAYEHRTASLDDRLRSARWAMEAGYSVRLCFDPILYVPGWRQCYADMLEQVLGQIAVEGLRDVSVGSFRISPDYLKKLRRVLPDSAVVQFPFVNEAGVCHYPAPLMEEMEGFVAGELGKYMPSYRIFRWK